MAQTTTPQVPVADAVVQIGGLAGVLTDDQVRCGVDLQAWTADRGAMEVPRAGEDLFQLR